MSTTLPIGEYIIDVSDGRNWTLKRAVTRKNRDTKEEYEGEDVLGYYSCLQAALKALFREHLANAGPSTIPKLTRYIEEAENRLVAAVTALLPKAESSPLMEELPSVAKRDIPPNKTIRRRTPMAKRQ